MKFAPFIYDYITCDDWDHLETILNYSNPREYLGFDLPFDLKELNDSRSPRWDELVNICNDYIERHGLEVIKSEEIYHDLEKGYEEYDVVFSFDGKYYQTGYYQSPWVSPYRDGYPDEVAEVFPHTKTIEVTEYY